MAFRSTGRLRLGAALVVATCSAPIVWVIADASGAPERATHSASEGADEPTAPAPTSQSSTPAREGLTKAPGTRRDPPIQWLPTAKPDAPPPSIRRQGDDASPPSYVGSLRWRSDRTPIRGATVRLAEGGRQLAGDRSPFARSTKTAWLSEPIQTNSLGQFSLPALSQDVWSRPLFLVVFPAQPDARVLRLPHPLTPGRTHQVDPIELDRPGGVRGKFVSARTGRGVAGVRIRAVDEPIRDPAASIATPGRRSARATIRPGLGLRRSAAGGSIAAGVNAARAGIGLLEQPTTASASDGSFELPRLRPGQSYLLAQSAAGIDWLIGWSVTPGRSTDVGTIRLPELQPVTLRLLEPNGQRTPLAAAQVALSPVRLGGAPGSRSTRGAEVLDSVLASAPLDSAVDGTWQVPRATVADQLVRVRRDPDAPWEAYRAIPDPPSADGLVHGYAIRLRALDRIFVSVLGIEADGTGYPIDPDTIDLLPAALPNSVPVDRFGQRPESTAWRFQRIGKGEFGCSAIPPGAYRVLVQAKGYGSQLFEVELRPAPRTDATREHPLHLAVRLQKTFPMEVLVRDAGGQPAVGATIRAELLPREPAPGAARKGQFDHTSRRATLHRQLIVLGRTDADGRLLRRGWVQDRIRITATHPDHGRAAEVVAGRRPQAIRLRLRNEGELRGRVRFGTSPPAESYRVEARPITALGGSAPDAATEMRRDPMVHSASTDEDGKFALTGLPAGGYRVTARRAADAKEPADPVQDPHTGSPARSPDHRVEVWLQPGQSRYVELDLGTRSNAYQEAKITGRVTLDGRMERGLQIIAALSTSEGSAVRFHRRLRAAQDRQDQREVDALQATLREHWAARRKAKLAPDYPLDFAPIYRASTIPDAYGEFRFRLPEPPGGPRRLTLIVARTEHGEALELARVTFDRPVQGPVQIDIGTGNIDLQVRRADGGLASRQRIRFEVGSTHFERTTDALGQLRLQRIPAGRYRVQLQPAPNALDERQGQVAATERGQFQLSPGANSVQTIRLAR